MENFYIFAYNTFSEMDAAPYSYHAVYHGGPEIC